MNYTKILLGSTILITTIMTQGIQGHAAEVGTTEVEVTVETAVDAEVVTPEVVVEEAVVITGDTTVPQNVGVGSILNEVAVIADKEVEKQIADEETWGYVNLGLANVDNHLNIRENPSESSKIVGIMTKDAACEIQSFDGEWAKIQSGEVEGYVSTKYLLMGEYAIQRASEVFATLATVTTNALKVREEPNTECAVVTTVANGEKLEVIDTSTPDWVKIRLDNEEVYVSAEYVTINDQLHTATTLTELIYGKGVSDVRVDMVNYAKQFVGNPYVWGGTSLTNGADCSGFVQTLYKKYGFSLPRTARYQVQVGTTVSASEMVAGDLVFYSQAGAIQHVALYIGGGQVIHASTPSTGIKISNAFYREPTAIQRILP